MTRLVLFHYTVMPEDLRYMARHLFRMIESRALRVSINQRFSLRQAADAHREIEARRTTGSSLPTGNTRICARAESFT